MHPNTGGGTYQTPVRFFVVVFDTDLGKQHLLKVLVKQGKG